MIQKNKSPKIIKFFREWFEENDTGVLVLNILKIIGVICLACVVFPFVGIYLVLKFIFEKVSIILNDIWAHVYKFLIIVVSILTVLFIVAFVAYRLHCPWLFDLVLKILSK